MRVTTTEVLLQKDMERIMHNFKYRDNQKLMRATGGPPDDIFKNAWLKVYQNINNEPKYIYYPIVGNKGYLLTIGYDDSGYNTYDKLLNASTNKYNSVRIDNLWRPGMAAWCVFPQMSDMWSFPTQYDEKIKPKNNLYYYIYIGEQNFSGTIGTQKD